MLWTVGWPVGFDAFFRWLVAPRTLVVIVSLFLVVFLDVVHPNARASRGCSFAISLPNTPPPSPGLESCDIDTNDVARCPFASRMPAVDPAYNPHVRPEIIATSGLETPPLTPLESENGEKSFLPLETISIPAHAKEPLDTSFLGVSFSYCFILT